MHKHIPVLSLILVLCLVTVACTPSQAIGKLQKIVTAVEIALPLVVATAPAVGHPVSPELQKIVNGYVQAVDKALDQTAAEMQSGEPAALQASKITGFFAGAVAPNLSGAPATYALAVQAISGAVEAFLESYGGTKSFAASAVPEKPVKLSGADKKALRDIQAKVRAQAAQLVR